MTPDLTLPVAVSHRPRSRMVRQHRKRSAQELLITSAGEQTAHTLASGLQLLSNSDNDALGCCCCCGSTGLNASVPMSESWDLGKDLWCDIDFEEEGDEREDFMRRDRDDEDGYDTDNYSNLSLPSLSPASTGSSSSSFGDELGSGSGSGSDEGEEELNVFARSFSRTASPKANVVKVPRLTLLPVACGETFAEFELRGPEDDPSSRRERQRQRPRRRSSSSRSPTSSVFEMDENEDENNMEVDKDDARAIRGLFPIVNDSSKVLRDSSRRSSSVPRLLRSSTRRAQPSVQLVTEPKDEWTTRTSDYHHHDHHDDPCEEVQHILTEWVEEFTPIPIERTFDRERVIDDEKDEFETSPPPSPRLRDSLDWPVFSHPPSQAHRTRIVDNTRHLLMLSLELQMMIHGKIVCPLRQRGTVLRVGTAIGERSCLRLEVTL